VVEEVEGDDVNIVNIAVVVKIRDLQCVIMFFTP